MNRLASLFVISLLIAVAFGQDKLFEKIGSGTRDNNIVHTITEPLIIPSNLDNFGELQVTVTTDTTVTVCINERVQVTAGINSCSIGGLFNFTWNTTMNRASFGVQSAPSDIITKTAYLRFGKADTPAATRTYFVSYQFVWDNPDKNDTGVSIVITGKKCANFGIGPGCGDYTPKYTPLVAGTPVPITLAPKSSHYFLFTAAVQYNFTQVEITGFNRSKDAIFLFGKRGGYPVYATNLGVLIPGSSDWYGVETGGNKSTILLNFGRPDDYWFAVAGNDSNPISFTISLTVGGEANKDNMHAQMPVFGNTKDNNTVEFDAATTNGVAITYLRFDRDELKIGIAPKDESDGSPDVFADIDLVPSAQSNLVSNTNSTEDAHLISVTSLPKANGFFWYTFTANSQKAADTIWYVAVNSTNPFVIWDASVGACANNCTNRGKCDESRGICVCDDGYERYDCSDKVFPLVWIILIAIGGAILLAIAIGVPVSCYVKNKKKSGYERV